MCWKNGGRLSAGRQLCWATNRPLGARLSNEIPLDGNEDCKRVDSKCSHFDVPNVATLNYMHAKNSLRKTSSQMRLRPRFSLRTLFVLVTIAGICSGWVAYQLNWIRQRHEFLNSREVQTDTDIMTLPGRLSWSLRILGEPAHGSVVVEPEYMQEAARLFPEARIYDAEKFRSAKPVP